ncbi:hypothetical protein SLA2020_279140 [Shorea laevis]
MKTLRTGMGEYSGRKNSSLVPLPGHWEKMFIGDCAVACRSLCPSMLLSGLYNYGFLIVLNTYVVFGLWVFVCGGLECGRKKERGEVDCGWARLDSGGCVGIGREEKVCW